MPEHDSTPTDPSSAVAVSRLLGPPIAADDATLSRAMAEGHCDALAFELYKEAATVAVVTYSLSSTGSHVLPRNQAICMGLLVRVVKFMTAVMQLSSTDNRREVVLSLTRSILESAVNLRFLLTKNDATLFDSFVKTALGPERELFDVIQVNIANRGGHRLPIEERMLNSIERTVRISGLTIDEVSPRRQEWGGTLRDRMKGIGEEEMYLSVQRIPSHAVHGSWVDLVLHHIEPEGPGFVPDPEWKAVDARLLTPIALLVLRAVAQYLDSFFQGYSAAALIQARIVDLNDRIIRTDAAHEQSMGPSVDAPAE